MHYSQYDCCGIREIAGLAKHRSAAAAFDAFYTLFYRFYFNNRFRYAVFAQADEAKKYGTNFAAYIRDHNLGNVIETDWNINPNSGNALKAWVWTVDHDAVKAHMESIEYEKKYGKKNKRKRVPKSKKVQDVRGCVLLPREGDQGTS